jgi:hypothetical protein
MEQRMGEVSGEIKKQEEEGKRRTWNERME